MLKQQVTNGVLQNRVHIVASPFKTGSTSVAEALKILGVGNRIMRYKGQVLQDLAYLSDPLNRLANNSDDFFEFEASYGQRVKRDLGPLVRVIKRYDIFHDAPFGHAHIHPFVRKVLAPKAHFIWVNREPKDWLASVKNWEESHPELYERNVLWQEDPEGQAKKHLKKWSEQYDRFKLLCDAFPQDCLELKWHHLQNFEALASYYQVAIPSTPFPKANVGRISAMRARRFHGIVTVGKAIADRIPMLEELLLRIYSILDKRN